MSPIAVQLIYVLVPLVMVRGLLTDSLICTYVLVPLVMVRGLLTYSLTYVRARACLLTHLRVRMRSCRGDRVQAGRFGLGLAWLGLAWLAGAALRRLVTDLSV